MDTGRKASIAIFKNSVDEDQNVSQPFVPDEVFTTAQEVIKSKGCKLIKTRNGVFVISYAENGPFPEKVGDKWLPVYVAKLQQWSSGGIQRAEMDAFLENQSEKNPTSLDIPSSNT